MTLTINLDFIEDNALVTVDTAPIIYLLEDHPQFAEEFLPLFQIIESGQIQAVVLLQLQKLFAGRNVSEPIVAS